MYMEKETYYNPYAPNAPVKQIVIDKEISIDIPLLLPTFVDETGKQRRGFPHFYVIELEDIFQFI